MGRLANVQGSVSRVVTSQLSYWSTEAVVHSMQMNMAVSQQNFIKNRLARLLSELTVVWPSSCAIGVCALTHPSLHLNYA